MGQKCDLCGNPIHGTVVRPMAVFNRKPDGSDELKVGDEAPVYCSIAHAQEAADQRKPKKPGEFRTTNR